MNIDGIPTPPKNEVSATTVTVSTTAPQSHGPDARRGSSTFQVTFEPRISPQHFPPPQITSIDSSRQEFAMQRIHRIGGYSCPDVALLDSDIAGELCDRRLSESSWQSDYLDADDYDKENQCVYRENIDNADNMYGFANPDNELGLHLSPAFSEDSMHPTNNNVASFGIQSY